MFHNVSGDMHHMKLRIDIFGRSTDDDDENDDDAALTGQDIHYGPPWVRVRVRVSWKVALSAS